MSIVIIFLSIWTAINIVNSIWNNRITVLNNRIKKNNDKISILNKKLEIKINIALYRLQRRTKLQDKLWKEYLLKLNKLKENNNA